MSASGAGGASARDAPPPDAPPAEAAPAGTLTLAVAVTDDAARALLTVHLEPSGSVAPPGAAAEAMPRAAAALAAAGVVHGIDGGAVGEALAAADGVARPVAHATAPLPPVDGRIVLVHEDAMRRDPLFTVPAGTVIAVREPSAPGTPGTDVLGRNIPPAEPREPQMDAGAGARLDTDAGRPSVVSAEDGRPVASAAAVGIDPAVRTGDVPPGARIEVHGTLVVQGDVGEGARIAASGAVVVGGMVAQAEVIGERGVAITGSCLGSVVRAGARHAARRRVVAALGPADAQVALLDQAAAQLLEGAAGPRAPREEAVLRVLAERRFTDLHELWAAAAAAARADGAAAGLGDGVADAVARLAAALHDLPGGGMLGRAQIVAARDAVAPDLARLRAEGGEGADVRAGYMQACRVEASGGLVVTGGGTYNTDAVVGGDVLAEAPGATVRGGAFEVGGRMAVSEIGSPAGEARVVVALAGAGAPGEVRLAAAVAHPGVEVALAGRVLRIERSTLNLAVGCDDNMRVVRSGEPAG